MCGHTWARVVFHLMWNAFLKWKNEGIPFHFSFLPLLLVKSPVPKPRTSLSQHDRGVQSILALVSSSYLANESGVTSYLYSFIYNFLNEKF